MNWVFVDLDMTLVDIRESLQKAGPEPEVGSGKRSAWLDVVLDPEMLKNAPAVPAVLNLVHRLLWNEKTTKVVFLTNRKESRISPTYSWLVDRNLIGTLRMRPDDCKLHHGDFKESVIRQHERFGDTVLVIDDDQNGSMERACNKNGWTLLKVVTFG
jgi:hypothetical protein